MDIIVGGIMRLQRPHTEDTWVFVIGFGVALMSGIFWREVFPAVVGFFSYGFEFIQWGLDELDKFDFFWGKVIIYTIVLLMGVWLWGYSAGEKSKGNE